MDTAEANAFLPFGTEVVLGAHDTLAIEEDIAGIAVSTLHGCGVEVAALRVDCPALRALVEVEPLGAFLADRILELGTVEVTNGLDILQALPIGDLVARVAGQASSEFRIETGTKGVNLGANAVGIEVEASRALSAFTFGSKLSAVLVVVLCAGDALPIA